MLSRISSSTFTCIAILHSTFSDFDCNLQCFLFHFLLLTLCPVLFLQSFSLLHLISCSALPIKIIFYNTNVGCAVRLPVWSDMCCSVNFYVNIWNALNSAFRVSLLSCLIANSNANATPTPHNDQE